ncbi:MAG: ABZJ_00895 family protein [Pseudomonadota bacterium]
MGLICRDFIVTYVLAMIGLLAVSLGVEALFQTDIGSAVNVVPQIVAALVAGQRHGKRTGIRPNSSFSWTAAFWMTSISVGLSLVLATGFIIYMGPGDAAPMFEFLTTEWHWFVGILAIFIVIYLLITRYFFGLGAKQGAQASPHADSEIFR